MTAKYIGMGVDKDRAGVLTCVYGYERTVTTGTGRTDREVA
jgi:hypothetical protein